MTVTKCRKTHILLLFLLLLFGASYAGAVDYEWVPDGDGTNWSDPDNWDADADGNGTGDGTGYPGAGVATDGDNANDDLAAVNNDATITMNIGGGVTIGELSTNASTISIVLAGSLTTDGTGSQNGNLSLGGASVALTTAGNSLTVGGTYASSGTLRLEGNETVTGLGTPVAGLVEYYGNGGTITGLSGGGSYTDLAFVDNTSGGLGGGTAFGLGGALTVNTSLDISAGYTLDLNGQNLDLTGLGTFTNTGTLRAQGGETVTNAGNLGSPVPGLVEYDGGGNYTGLIFGDSYTDLTFSGAGEWQLDAALSVGNNLDLSAGALVSGGNDIGVTGTFTNGGTLRLVGNETSVTGLGTPVAGLVEYYGNGGTITGLSGGGSYTDLAFVDNTSGGLGGGTAFGLGGALTVNTSLDISAGYTLDLNGQNLDLTGLGTFTNTGTLRAQGGETVTNAGNLGSPVPGLVEYDGGGNYTGLIFGDSYTDLTFSGAGTWTLDNPLTVSSDLSISSGTLDVDAAGDHQISVGANWNNSGGTFNEQQGTVEFTSDGTIQNSETFYNLTKTTGGTTTLGAAITVSNTFTLSAGTFDVDVTNDYQISVGRDWNHSGGTFNERQGIVEFITAGTPSQVLGATTFYNFTSTAAGKQISFDAGETQTVTNALTLTGASGSELVLRSTGTSPWLLDIDGAGTVDVDYVDVQYGDIDGTTVVTPTNGAINSGYNDVFDSSLTVAIYGNDDGRWDFQNGTGVDTEWTGNNSADWYDPGNWDTGIPGPDDIAQIPDDTTASTQPQAEDYIDVDTLTLQDATSVLTMEGNDLTVNSSYTSAGTLRLRGDETTVTGLGSPIDGTVEYYGPGGTVTGLVAGNSYEDLAFVDNTGGLGAGTDFNLGAGLTVSSSLDISAGYTLDLNGQNLDLTGLGTFTNTGTLRAQGGETVTNAGNLGSPVPGLVEYDGGGNYTGLIFGDSYTDLTFSGAGTWTLDNPLTVNDDLTISNGTLDVDGTNDYQISVGANWNNSGGTFNEQQGTVEFTSDGTIQNGETFYNLTKSTVGTTTNLNAGITVSNDLTIASGTLDSEAGGPYDLTVGGDWSNTGAFVSGTNLVTFTGTNPNIDTGGTGAGQDFYNLQLDDGAAFEDQLQVNNNSSIGGTISTSGGDFNLRFGNVTLISNATITSYTTNGADISTGTIDADDAAANDRTLSLDAGTTGAITVGGDVGTGEALEGLTVVNSDGATFSGDVTVTDGAAAVTISDTQGGQTVSVDGALTTDDLTVTDTTNAYNVSLPGDGTAVTNAVTFGNDGSVTLGDADTDTLSFTGGLTATNPSQVNIAGTINADGGDMDLSNQTVVVDATSEIDTEQGDDGNAGVIDLGGATVYASGTTYDLTLDARTTDGASNGGQVTLGSFGDNGGGNDFIGALTVQTTGGATDGTLSSPDAVAISGELLLDIGTGNNATVTAAGTDVDSLRVDSAGDVSLDDDGGLDIAVSSVDGALDIISTGAITDSGQITVGGTASFETRNDSDGAASITLDQGGAGTPVHTFGAMTLRTRNSGNTGNVNSNITVYEDDATMLAQVDTAGTLEIASTGSITDTGTLTTATADLSAEGDITLDDDGSPYTNDLGTLVADITTNAGDLTVRNDAALQLGDGTAGISVADGAVDIEAAGALTQGSAGTVVTTDTAPADARNITLTTTTDGIAVSENITAANDAVVTLDAAGSITRSGGTITTTGAGVVDLTSGAGGAIGADGGNDGTVDGGWVRTDTAVLRISAGSGGAWVQDADAIELGDGTAGVSAAANGLLFIDSAAGTVTTARELTTDGPVSLRSQAGTPLIQLGHNITTSADAVRFYSPVELTANVSVDTTDSGASPAGGDIDFDSTIDADTAGAQTLNLDGGNSGDVTLVAAAGGTTALGNVTVSGRVVSFRNVTTANGSVTVTGDTGDIDPGGSVLNLSGSIDTTDSGTADGAQITLTTGGNNDQGELNLGGGTSVLRTAGNTADADITIEVALNDSANDDVLDIVSGTGTLYVNRPVGATSSLSYIRVLSVQTLDSTAGTINLSGQPVFLDVPGLTVEVRRNLTVGSLIFYRGTLDLGTNDVTLATSTAGGASGDLVVFGQNYGPTDVDRSTTHPDNAFFRYPDAGTALTYVPGAFAGTDSGLADTDGSDHPGPAGDWAAFSDLEGAAVSVAGNLYVNGADLTGTGPWTLTVQDLSSASPASAPGNGAGYPFGTPYNTVFHSTVQNSQVTQGDGQNIMAIAPVDRSGDGDGTGAGDPVDEPEDARNNFVYDGGGNTTFTYDTGSESVTQTGWDFTAPSIASAEIVRDDVIRVTFTEPVENDGGQLSSTATGTDGTGIYFDYRGGSGTNGAMSAALLDRSTSNPDGLPFSFSATEAADGDRRTVYFRAAGGRTWNTDADGDEASVSGTGTDGTGSSQSTIPDLSFAKAMFHAANSSAPARNYTQNGKPTFTATTDQAGPVLYEIRYGRAAQDETTAYDGHNYFHLYWSEPVDLDAGSGNGFDLGTGATATNVRSETTLGSDGGWGGDIRFDSGLGKMLVDGYFAYDVSGDDEFSRGARTGPASANGLYRTHVTGTDPFNAGQNDQELRIYLSGYLDGALGSGLYPGWHADVPDPADADTTSIEVIDNSNVVDALGNQIDYQIDPDAWRREPTSGNVGDAGSAPRYDFTGGEPYFNAWDVDPPIFSSFDVNRETGEPIFYEIVSRATTVTNLVNRIEFHILDNAAYDYRNTTDYDDPEDVGFWDPRPDPSPPDTEAPLYQHPDERRNEGVRDATYDYPGDGLTETEAFTVQEVGVEPLTNEFNVGFDTTIDNNLFGNVTASNDSYFTLSIQDTGHGWGLLTDLYVAYDSTAARITDLAGNLLPSALTPLALIERTPPRIELALAVPGRDRIYVRFSEPVWSDPDQQTTLAPGDFNLNAAQAGNGIAEIETISTDEVEGAQTPGQREVYFITDEAIDPNDLIGADIEALEEAIFDKAENAMPPNIDRRISDVGINLVDPIWASDGVVTFNDAPAEGESSRDSGVIRDFTGGSVLTDKDIRLQARIVPDLYTGLPLELVYDVGFGEANRAGEFWSPSVISGLIASGDENANARFLDPYEAATNGLRTFLIPEEDPEIENGAEVEFLFRLGNLDVARITGTEADLEPEVLAPWRFGIQGIIEQRAGVTILNNVIDPTQGERTILQYELKEAGLVRINVFTVDGSLVRRLETGRKGEGTYTTTWDGTNASGDPVARGIYFIRFMAPGVDEYRKVMVVK